MITIKKEKIAEMMFDIWHESDKLKNPVMVGEYIANKLKEAINYTHCCKSDSELLPKRLSNEAYKCARTMDYTGFVNWWDKQV